MNTSEGEVDQISVNLLSFLKEELGDTKVDFSSRPTKIEGGNETSIYHFKLEAVQPSLSRPLVLRKFRKGRGAAR